MPNYIAHLALIARAAATIATATKLDHDRVATANTHAAALQRQVTALQADLYAWKRQAAWATAGMEAARHQLAEATVRPGLQAALADVCRMTPSHQ